MQSRSKIYDRNNSTRMIYEETWWHDRPRRKFPEQTSECIFINRSLPMHFQRDTNNASRHGKAGNSSSRTFLWASSWLPCHRRRQRSCSFGFFLVFGTLMCVLSFFLLLQTHDWPTSQKPRLASLLRLISESLPFACHRSTSWFFFFMQNSVWSPVCDQHRCGQATNKLIAAFEMFSM